MTKAKYLKEREDRLKAEGICVRCAVNTSVGGTTTCQTCKDLKAAKRKTKARITMPLRVCKCGKECARSSFQNGKCPICWEAENNLYTAPHRGQPRKGSRAAWRAVGWCLGCGHPERWIGSLYCNVCLHERAQP